MNNNSSDDEKHSSPDENEKRKEYPQSVDPKMVENRRNEQIPNKPWEDDPERFDVNYQPARQFLNCKSEEDIEKSTIDGYESSLRIYVDYLNELDNVTPEKAEYGHIYSFFDFLTNEHQRAKSTLRRYKVIVKQLHNFLEKYDSYEDPIFNTAKFGFINLSEIANKLHTFQRVSISRNEVELMYNTALSPSSDYSTRDELLLRVLYETGGRNGDVAGLTWNNVRNEEDGVWIYYLNGKGGDDNRVPVREDLAIRIKQFWHEDRKSIPGSDEHDYIFASQHGGRLSNNRITQIVKGIAEEAGIQEPIAQVPTTIDQPDCFGEEYSIYRVTPHTFRHSIVTHLSDDEVPRKLLKFLTGHSSDAIKDYDHSDRLTAFNLLRESIT